MNYPIWEVPGSGLLIAGVAILHVFISHFAVGGGLFLVVTERKARRDHDRALLDYVRCHSRFFMVLTMVLGTITGAGIWSTIGLVHPQATASLINIFVWVWAIEYTMFATEIAAALVYYYGWDRLSARTHERVGWIYCWAAWLSLVVINGILAFMLTPGRWVETRNIVDGFLNPIYLSSVVGRTAAAIGLAGLYALLTASWSGDAALKATVARYAGLRWIVPMAAVVPLSLLWYLAAAAGAGVPVREIFGAAGNDFLGVATAIVGGADSGYPVARAAALASMAASVIVLLVTLVIVFVRHRSYGRVVTAMLMLGGITALGGAEWTREDLRKPYVIGQYMFVNGVRLPPAEQTPAATPEGAVALRGDRFTVDALNATGVLGASPWVRVQRDEQPPLPADQIARQGARGREVFRLECTPCHTMDGYHAIRPLVRGKSPIALSGTIDRLASPVDASGAPASWGAPRVRLVTWRNRRMPPLVGTPDERQALAVYLALVGGATAGALAAQAQETASAGTGTGEAAMIAAWTGTIPRADPLPQPGPTWLLWGLLVGLFFLHLLAMNLMLGGSIIGAVARLRGRHDQRPHHRALSAWFAAAMPAIIAAAVSLGVAALLFLQVLYGRLFFTSAVLIGWFWLAVIPVLILAYASAYRLAFESEAVTTRNQVLSWLIAVSFMSIAFVYVNNMSLLIRPDQFVPKYLRDGRGLHLNVADPTLLPRLLHMVLGAIAVAGLAVAHLGVIGERRDGAFGRWLMRHGSIWFSSATAINLIPGIWWLAVLPKETVLRFMGQSVGAALVLAGGAVFGLASLVMMVLAIQSKRPAGIIKGGSAVLVAALALMVLTRDQVRTAALETAGYDPTSWVVPQWGLILSFAALLVAALALIGWMIMVLARGTSGADSTRAAVATSTE